MEICECDLRMKILLLITLCLISDGEASKKVTGYSGGEVLIKCKYDPEDKQNEKYFCKGSWPSCSDRIRTGTKNKWINYGRFSVFDETNSAEFRVMIRELTVRDTGLYNCGVDKSWIDIYTPVELKIKEGGKGAREVNAYTGGGVNIKCRYEKKYKDKPKSICKLEKHQRCSNRAETKWHNEWSHDGRFSIHDNRNAGFFSVFIREMITEDTGIYRCAAIVSDEIEIYTVVKLNVEKDDFPKSSNKTVRAGGNLNISCEYPESIRGDAKFLCKRLQTAACFYKISVQTSRKEVHDGKLFLHDDRAKRILNVSMRNLSEQDSGEYWCGGEKVWTSDQGYKIYFTRIELTVSAQPTEPAQPSSTSSTPVSSLLLLSSLQPTTNIVQTGLSPLYIVIIVLMNLLIGLLIGSIFLFVIHRIKGKNKATRNNDKKAKNNTRVFASETGTSTGYSTDIYANTTHDSANTPSAALLQTSLPDSSTSAAPADGVTYASVRFHHSAPSADNAAPKINFNKKEEALCEYATVSYANPHG